MNNMSLQLIAPGLLAIMLGACVTTDEQTKFTGDGQKTISVTVKPETLIFCAVGDVMLGGTARPELEKYGYDYPFEKTKNIFGMSDIVFANLEGPLSNRGESVIEKKYKFRSPPEKVAPALRLAGINIVSLANNHTMDYGEQGLVDTMTALEANGIAYAGAGRNLFQARKPAIVKVKNTRISLLAYSLTFPEEFWAKKSVAGTAFGHESYIKYDVEQAKKNSDLVIVSFHWGRESTTELRPYQISLGHTAIDAGATVVLGHHPHILQAVERYKKGVILYSLGNYVFGSYSQKAKRSAIAKFIFTDNQLTALQLLPINVNNSEVVFQPRLLAQEAAKKVVQQLNELSAQRGTEIKYRNGVADVALDTKQDK